ncbi:MAG: putative enoyl-CoA hydratase echA8 [Pelotomaculum sp. PtaU1.Bin035]|nr:MAG: putative enoyl-CoA hydratase echA8 [Pelotomaculum sp. PtaU1.Bin035]
MSDQYKNLIVTKEDGVATITLNRPEVFNCMTPELMSELTNALGSIANDDEAKCVVITGAGKAFCSGGDVELDVALMNKMTPLESREYLQKFVKPINLIYSMEKPVIAAVNGLAGGGGCDLAMACDIRVASESAKFATFYVRMGITPALGCEFFLPRLVGLGKAKLMAFTGDIIDARQAEHFGLVDVLVSESEFASAVQNLAHRLAKGPTKAIGMTKIAMNKSMNMDLEASMDYARNLVVLTTQTEDYREGFQAFLEKRKAIFKGK